VGIPTNPSLALRWQKREPGNYEEKAAGGGGCLLQVSENAWINIRQGSGGGDERRRCRDQGRALKGIGMTEMHQEKDRVHGHRNITKERRFRSGRGGDVVAKRGLAAPFESGKDGGGGKIRLDLSGGRSGL